MDLNEMLRIIREFFPEKAVELSESLELLRDTMEDTRQDIKKLLDILYDQGQHDEMIPHIQLASSISEYITKTQELQTALELEDQLPLESDDEGEDKNELPDYQAYAVDSEVVHTLRESFTYTRPAAFELRERRMETRTWQAMLVNTCEILLGLDMERLMSFETDPAMRGRKQKMFSSDPTNMRKPIKIENSNLYVETNMSANAIRNLIIKMLQKYNIKPSEYKVYLRADYSGMH